MLLRRYGNIKKCHFVKQCSTRIQLKETKESNIEIEWENAKPYSSIPGLSKAELIRAFLPGGKFYNLHILDVNKGLHREYGSISKLPGMFGKRDLVVTFDPKDIEAIYRNDGQWPIRRGMDTFEYYRKYVRPDLFEKVGGLVNEQGEAWGKLRTIVNPIMMKPKLVKAYIPDIDIVARDFIEKIKTIRDEKNEMPDDFRNELHKWALESITLIALEHRLGLFTEDKVENQSIINAVRDFFCLSYELDVKPSIWKYYKTPKFNRLMEALNIMTDLAKKHVDRAVEKFENQTETHDGHEESVLQKILRVDKQYAIVMALDMLLAGIDTTGSASAYLLFNLAKNQNAQDRLRKEIMTLLPNIDSPLTPDSLNNLPYLRACMKESMRVTPVVGGNIRAAGRNMVLQGYQVPKGVDCFLGTVTLTHNDAFVERSSEFIPERFLKEVQPGCPNAKDINPFINLPFGFGPRSCIGKRLAEMELEVITVRLIREFKVEWNYGPLTFGNALLIVPASKLKFKLTDVK